MDWTAPTPIPAHLVLPDVVEEHASEAAFVWTLRESAARSPAYTLRELADVDERVEAHLDGVLLAGAIGLEQSLNALEEREPGEVFAASFTSLAHQDLSAFASVLDATELDPALMRAMVSALGWLPFDCVRTPLMGLVAAKESPELQCLGLAGHAAHRRDPGGVLDIALAAEHTGLRARALRLVGELGRGDPHGRLRGAWFHQQAVCRFWSLWSSVLLGDCGAWSQLQRLAEEEEDECLATSACEMVVRQLSPSLAGDWLQALAASRVRMALRGAGVLGDPALVPWLLSFLRDDEHARLAGAALVLITGADLANELEGEEPEGFVAGPSDDPEDEDTAMDPDDDLPWPNAEAVEAWWQRHQAAFQPHTRYVLGRPMDASWLREVQCAGHQVARAHCSLELCIRQPGQPLFEVRAPGRVQLQRLGLGQH